MQMNQNTVLTYNQETEYVVIPYLEEVKKEELKLLLPTLEDKLPLDVLIQENNKPVIHMEETWVQFEFLLIKREQVNPIEDIRKAFSSFGKSNKHNCQILFEHLHIEGIKEEELLQVAVHALFEGAYTFNKKALTKVTSENIFSMREALTDEKEGLTITIITNIKSSLTSCAS